MRAIFVFALLLLVLVGLAQSIVPVDEGENQFSITNSNLRMEVDALNGARISSFKLDGSELLYIDFSNNNMAGSTFWPSPQSVWNWPPPANLDNKPFEPFINGNRILFTGEPDSKSGLRFYKTMYASEADTSVVIEYVMKNEKTTARTWAPWEVTRVKGNGLTVFAKGEGDLSGNMVSRAEEINGYVWYDQDNSAGGDKFFCDGQGWLAHVIEGDKLFVKVFKDIGVVSAAPGEAEIEVYTAPGNTYSELENQGVYVPIASKDSVTWTVKWFARMLPPSVEANVGSTSLVSYIEGIIQRSSDQVANEPLTVENQVGLYPVPASEYLFIESNFDSYRNISLLIFNMQGRLLMCQPVAGRKQKVDVSSFDFGNYIFRVCKDSKTVGKGLFSVN